MEEKNHREHKAKVDTQRGGRYPEKQKKFKKRRETKSNQIKQTNNLNRKEDLNRTRRSSRHGLRKQLLETLPRHLSPPSAIFG